jgi:hypothetical protein
VKKRMIIGALAGLATGVLMAGGVAFATVPAADGKVWVCYGNNEALRVLDKDAGETCRGTELALLGASAKAADAELLDGKDSTAFYEAGAKVADADKLDGVDATGFLTTAAWPRVVTVVDVYREHRDVTVPADTTETVDVACSRSDWSGSTPWTIDPAMSGGISGLDTTTHLGASHAFPHDAWRWTVTTGSSPDTFTVEVTCLYHGA